jgi:hypothetical protein
MPNRTCAAGTGWENATSGCTRCTQGYSSVGGLGATCLPCACDPGSESPENGAAHCMCSPCPSGTASASGNAAMCQACRAGRYSPTVAAGGAQCGNCTCEPGTASPQGAGSMAGACAPCEPRFGSKGGTAQCVRDSGGGSSIGIDNVFVLAGIVVCAVLLVVVTMQQRRLLRQRRRQQSADSPYQSPTDRKEKQAAQSAARGASAADASDLAYRAITDDAPPADSSGGGGGRPKLRTMSDSAVRPNGILRRTTSEGGTLRDNPRLHRKNVSWDWKQFAKPSSSDDEDAEAGGAAAALAARLPTPRRVRPCFDPRTHQWIDTPVELPRKRSDSWGAITENVQRRSEEALSTGRSSESAVMDLHQETSEQSSPPRRKLARSVSEQASPSPRFQQEARSQPQGVAATDDDGQVFV